MLRYLVISLVGVLAVSHVSGYGGGAPDVACGDMIPQHHVDPQKSPAPYRVTIDKKTIKPGDKVQVTISGTKNAKEFKGYFVQARVGDTPVGKFESAPKSKLVNCGNGKANGITHASADAKERVTLTWIAPKDLSETIRFRTTVAKNGGEFWVGILSSPIKVSK